MCRPRRDLGSDPYHKATWRRSPRNLGRSVKLRCTLVRQRARFNEVECETDSGRSTRSCPRRGAAARPGATVGLVSERDGRRIVAHGELGDGAVKARDHQQTRRENQGRLRAIALPAHWHHRMLARQSGRRAGRTAGARPSLVLENTPLLSDPLSIREPCVISDLSVIERQHTRTKESHRVAIKAMIAGSASL